MSNTPIPGSVAERVEAFQAKRAAEGLPPMPTWRAVIESSDTSEEAIAAQREFEEEIQRARIQDRVDLGLDDPPLIVWKNWEHGVGVVSDPEGYAEIAAAGQAIREAEREEARRGEADREGAA